MAAAKGTELLQRLPAEERARAGRFRLEKDRLAFTLGRVLTRRLLSEFAPVPPGGWRFTIGPYGRPELAGSPLRFSISHCDGMVAVACTEGPELGLDVEPVGRKCDELELARSSFAAAEIATIEAAPPEHRRPIFFELWTLKEAYVKARGLGLGIPLSGFSVSLDPPAIAFSDEAPDDPRRWLLWRARPAGFAMALAAVRGVDEAVEVVASAVTVP